LTVSDGAPTDATSKTKRPGDYPRRIAAAKGRSEKITLTADWILQEFAAYYSESRHLPELAKRAFEERDHATSLTLSKRRLALYSTGISELGIRLREAYPRVADDAVLWREVEESFLLLIQGRYHELSEFLRSIMPKRPLGLHYSTIGFNHVGKVAVMNELRDELIGSDDVLETAVGFRGTVAIGFSSPKSAYNLKVIRDKPTANYKWGTFDGIESVKKSRPTGSSKMALFSFPKRSRRASWSPIGD
jgi:isocitrate dehydrogenase kinase/phosphatase